ncbi:MAG TPA: serine acetyltransferase, partial [Novosphingobium sp.]
NGVGGKRHPTLEDGVIVGSGAQILGPIVVGARARVGANAVVTEDVPEGATMVGVKARSTLVPAETWQRGFMPYGTPCKEPCSDSAELASGAGRIAALEAELAALRAELAGLREAITPPPPSRKRSEG